MKMVKSLILGSAAGLLAMSGAQAADLPVKAKAVEYVRICSLYGAGFYYIPGTDTCIKLSGYLRADVLVHASDFNAAYNGNLGQGNRLRNELLTRTRETLDIDTRTATEYGVLRTFANLNFSWTTGSEGIGGGNLGVYHAFIQFAGFTMGRTISIFDAPWVNYPANNFDGLVGGSGTVTGVNQLTYTAQFGNGVSAAISAADQTGGYYQTNIYNLSNGPAVGLAGLSYGGQSIGGQVAPNLEAMVRVDQAWGLFQASLAAHDNHVSYYNPALETSGHPDDKWGWAGQLSLSLKNIPTGPGDTINVQGAYANGAPRYVFSSLVATNYAMFAGTNLPGAYQSVALAAVSDSVFVNGGSQQLTTSYGVRGGYTHNWDPYWNTSIFGAWAHMQYNGNAKAVMCVGPGGGLGGTVGGLLTPGSTCNPDFDSWQIGTKTGWTPVKNFTISGEIVYAFIDQKYAGSVALAPGPTKPAAIYELKDQGTWAFMARAQRNW